MALDRIKHMLKETIGLHSRSIGDISITRAVQHRMALLALATEDAYLARLRAEPAELDELIEEVVVPETWFYRNVAPFRALAHYVPQLRQAGAIDAADTIRILSLPCSSGEEPYSIAMVLSEAADEVGPFAIDACDVSKRAIRKARRAIYGRHAFREENLDLLQRYFRPTGGGYQLDPALKAHVSFTRANIISDSFAERVQAYDVIFCRNLLIYFDRPTQQQVLGKLHRMLKPHGVLCVGHAETSQVMRNDFQPLDIPMAFAFRKGALPREPQSGAAASLAPVPPAATSAAARSAGVVQNLQAAYRQLAGVVLKAERKPPLAEGTTTGASAEAVEPAATAAAATLDGIAQLLDLGRLGEAAQQCERWLAANAESADGYYYLGLISRLQGSPGGAEVLLKKAVYLDPQHHRALGLLALMAEKRGEGDLAADYRRRQQRARRRKDDAR